jgi:cytochrome c556
MKFAKKIIAIMLTVAVLALVSGCVTANPNSEVMVDTSVKKAKNVPDGASEPGDFEKMSDPFLSGN